MPSWARHDFTFSDDYRRAVEVGGTVMNVALNGVAVDGWHHQGGILLLLRDRPVRGDVLTVLVVE